MATPYQVNIAISAGTDFTQEYSITNPDGSPVNLLGFKIFAKLAKHPTAIDAVTSTSGTPVYNYIPFEGRIVDAGLGIYSITMTAATTSLLPEGKYLYNVVIENTSGEKSPAVSGLAFVDVAFGAFGDLIAEDTPEVTSTGVTGSSY